MGVVVGHDRDPGLRVHLLPDIGGGEMGLRRRGANREIVVDTAALVEIDPERRLEIGPRAMFRIERYQAAEREIALQALVGRAVIRVRGGGAPSYRQTVQKS